jgi:hypothetical protein
MSSWSYVSKREGTECQGQKWHGAAGVPGFILPEQYKRKALAQRNIALPAAANN